MSTSTGAIRRLLEENAHAILRYLDYLDRNLNEKGLMETFVWATGYTQTASGQARSSSSEVSNTIISMNIAAMSERVFEVVLGLQLQGSSQRALRRKAEEQYQKTPCVTSTMTVLGRCQTAHPDNRLRRPLTSPKERPKAIEVLLKLIEEKDYYIDVGMHGLRVIYHVPPTRDMRI